MRFALLSLLIALGCAGLAGVAGAPAASAQDRSDAFAGLERLDPLTIIFWQSIRQARKLAELKGFFEASVNADPVPPNVWPRRVIAAISEENGEGRDDAGAQNAEPALSGTRLVPGPAPVGACDWLAAHPDDPRNFGPAVEWEHLRPHAAIVACKLALHRHPRSPRIQFQLARAYEKAGKIDIAAKLYRMAADGGSTSAMVNLGLMHHSGRGVARDTDTAIELYRKAAALGHPGAMYSLGLVHARGHGAKKDLKKAVDWLEKAADHGLSRAMYSLGVLYAGGRGLEEDVDEAVTLFRKAAELGHPGAMNKMGMAFVSGTGVEEKDFQKAVRWYRDAAGRGHLPAMYNMAIMNSRGWGTPKNSKIADAWYRKAARGGYRRAVRRLRETGEVQKLLAEAGYDPGPVDGIFGSKTSDAIKTFAGDKGLENDGKITDGLVTALLAAVETADPEKLEDEAEAGFATVSPQPAAGEAEAPEAKSEAGADSDAPEADETGKGSGDGGDEKTTADDAGSAGDEDATAEPASAKSGTDGADDGEGQATADEDATEPDKAAGDGEALPDGPAEETATDAASGGDGSSADEATGESGEGEAAARK